MRRCTECGKEFEGAGSFCPNCGKYLPFSETAPVETAMDNQVNCDDIPEIPPYVPNQNGFGTPSGFVPPESSKAEFESCVTPSTGSFVLSLFLSAIPIVGFIYILCLAFGATKYKAKKNLARALFIWTFVCLVIESAILIAVMYFYPDFVNQLNLQYINEIKDFFAFFK